MDTVYYVSLAVLAILIFGIVAIISYMKLSHGKMWQKFKSFVTINSNNLSTVLYIKKILFFGFATVLNIGLSVFVLFCPNGKVTMSLLIILKLKDIISVTIWILHGCYKMIANKLCTQKPIAYEIDVENATHRNIVSIVPVYSETCDQIQKTLNSLVDNNIEHYSQLIAIICDGKDVGVMNILTPAIVSEKINYTTWKQTDNSITVSYCGYKNTPCVVMMKSKNQGKKDSLILAFDIFNYPRSTFMDVHIRERIRDGIKNNFGGFHDFDYMFCTDADSVIVKNSFVNLISTIDENNAHACCGLVTIDFEDKLESIRNLYGAFWYVFQNFQYLYGQIVRRTCENVFKTVTCMPGCITMFKVNPVASEAIKMYSELPPRNALIKNSVQMLGTDRRLASSFLMQSSDIRHMINYDAICYTIPPDNLYQYISQRRRWGSNMYFNSICNMCGRNIKFIIRVFCALDICRVTLPYFRIFNTVIFIYSIVTCDVAKIVTFIPFVAIIAYPVCVFFVNCVCRKFLRQMLFKLILGYLISKIMSIVLSFMVITNIFWNIGSTLWGGVVHANASDVDASNSPSKEVIEMANKIDVFIEKSAVTENDVVTITQNEPTIVTSNISESDIHVHSYFHTTCNKKHIKCLGCLTAYKNRLKKCKTFIHCPNCKYNIYNSNNWYCCGSCGFTMYRQHILVTEKTSMFEYKSCGKCSETMVKQGSCFVCMKCNQSICGLDGHIYNTKTRRSHKHSHKNTHAVPRAHTNAHEFRSCHSKFETGQHSTTIHDVTFRRHNPPEPVTHTRVLKHAEHGHAKYAKHEHAERVEPVISRAKCAELIALFENLDFLAKNPPPPSMYRVVTRSRCAGLVAKFENIN